MSESDAVLGPLARKVAALTGLLAAIGAARVRGDVAAARSAERALAEALTWLLSTAAALGRQKVAAVLPPPIVAAKGGGGSGLIYPESPIPNAGYLEPLARLIERTPRIVSEEQWAAVRLLRSGERGRKLAEMIGQVYRERGFALARAASVEITDRVQRLVGEGLRGATAPSVEAAIADVTGTSEAYARTVLRNNVSHAYHDGLFTRAQDPDVRRVVAGGAFEAVGGRDGDGRTTALCRAFHGTRAPFGHPIWSARTPPCHHNCRSGIRTITWAAARRRGWVTPAGDLMVLIPHADMKAAPGFGAAAMAQRRRTA